MSQYNENFEIKIISKELKIDMPAEDLLEDYIKTIEENFAEISEMSRKLLTFDDSKLKFEMKEKLQEINIVLTKKFNDRLINHSQNKTHYINKKQSFLHHYWFLFHQFGSDDHNSKSDFKISIPGLIPVKVEKPERIKEVLTVQDEILESLVRSKGINIETLRIANRVGEKLLEQTENLETIQKKVDNLGDGLTRAGKEANSFMRGVMTDKIMLCLIFVIVIFGIIGLGLSVGYNIY